MWRWITVRLVVFSLTGMDLILREIKALFVCIEAVEFKLVKLETSCTVIPPPRWFYLLVMDYLELLESKPFRQI